LSAKLKQRTIRHYAINEQKIEEKTRRKGQTFVRTQTLTPRIGKNTPSSIGTGYAIAVRKKTGKVSRGNVREDNVFPNKKKETHLLLASDQTIKRGWTPPPNIHVS